MAKCVRLVGQGVPVRLSDADAHVLVARDSDAEYCPKHVWRDWNTTYNRAPYYARLSPGLTAVETLYVNHQRKRHARRAA